MTGPEPWAAGASVADTTRTGDTDSLCLGHTTTGTLRSYFARAPQDPPVTTIPTGYVLAEEDVMMTKLIIIRGPSGSAS
jgi:hypothetical protein